MSENKDQPHDSPSESAGFNFDDLFLSMNKKTILKELQRQAYYDVLQAFSAAESPSPLDLIIHDLKKEWKISDKTNTDFQNKIQKLRGRVSPESLVGKRGVSTRMHGKEADLLLQEKAYYSVYWAIIADEDTEAVKAGTKIIKRLKTAWKIEHEIDLFLRSDPRPKDSFKGF